MKPPIGEPGRTAAPSPSQHATRPAPGARRGLAGAGLLAVWIRVRPRDEDDLNRWYATEHLPERLGVPGFLGARRYLDPVDRTYLALYELTDPAVITAPDYQQRFSQPTDWTRRVLASFQWSRRRVYRLAATRGGGVGGCAGALVLDQAGDQAGDPDGRPGEAQASEARPDAALLDAALSDAAGLVAAHLLVAAEDRLLLLEGTPDAVRARVAALTARLGLTPGRDTCVGDLLVCV